MTILCDKFSGHPKGSVLIYRTFNFLWKLYRELNFTLFWFSFAYIEFTDKESVDNAVNLDESLFKGRQIKVPNLKLENARKVLVSVISRWTRSKLIFFFLRLIPKEQTGQDLAQQTEDQEEEEAGVEGLGVDSSTLMQVICPDHVEGLCIGNLFCICFFATLIDLIFLHICILFCLLKGSGKNVLSIQCTSKVNTRAWSK